MENDRKNSAIIFLTGVIIVFVIIGSYFALLRKLNDAGTFSLSLVNSHNFQTSALNFKTYTNDQYGFEFQYPSNAKVELDNGGGFIAATLSLVASTGKEESDSDRVTIRVYTKKATQDIFTGAKEGENDGIKVVKGSDFLIQIFGSTGSDKALLSAIKSSVKITTVTAITPLAEIYSHGGLCYTTGLECKSTTTIDSGGMVMTNGKHVKNLSQAELADLIKKINAENFKAIEATKFTGTCPTAYDGAEVVYTFYANTGVHVLDSCKVIIDTNSGPFSGIFKLIRD